MCETAIVTVEHFFSTYIDPIVPIGAVIIVYYLGRSAYFRQKEYELITERYLRQGLDRVTDQVERSLGQFRHNWARSLTVLKMFRELGTKMNEELYEGGFVEPDPSLYEIWTDYRVRDLIADDIVNHARQSLDAFIRSSYEFFAEDLCTAVRLAVEAGKVQVEREKIAEKYVDKIMELNQESHRYYNLLGELQKIASALQTQRFSFGKLDDFRATEAVRKSLEVLREEFGKDTSVTPAT